MYEYPPQGESRAGNVSAQNVLLNSTNPIEVLKFTPSNDKLLQINATVDVVTAATLLTLKATWENSNTGVQTYTWEKGVQVSPGTRMELPILVLAKAGTPVSITGTAGTANQVFISSQITYS